MGRRLRIIGYCLAVILSTALYREWVQRSRNPLYIPLGFRESVTAVITPEKRVSLPETWNDPIQPVTMDGETFDELARASGAGDKTVDVLIVGGTLGGTASLLAAAEDGANAMLVSEHDWRDTMFTHAGLLLEEPAPPVEPSAIEKNIRRYLTRARGTSGTERGMPRDIVEYLESALDLLPEDSVLSEYSVAALARDESGRLQRALIRSNDGTRTIAVRFTTMIDSTKEGSLMALAGIETRSGWDVGTGEPSAIPATAIDAMTNGYTMSGRTTAGIGRRLDGVRAQMGIVDRGYHGTFLAPSRADDCWRQDLKSTSRIAKQTVMRSNNVDCSASFVFESGFQDTVEVFYVNHTNQHVSATIRSGSGTPLSVEVSTDPSTPFIRIGAFSVSNVLPLFIDVRSTLPTDRLEGLIVRKLNTGAAPAQFPLTQEHDITYVAGPWTYTTHDVYVQQPGLSAPPTIKIDDDVFSTTQVGRETYAARSIALRSGARKVRIAEQTIDGFISIIPVAPATASVKALTMEPGANDPKNTNRTWELTPERDGTIVVTIPRKACAAECSFQMNDENAQTMFSGIIDTLSDRPVSAALLGMTDVIGGNTYVISISSDQKNIEPTVAYLDEMPGIHELGTTSVVLRVPTDGRMYDIWVRSNRSMTPQVTMRGTTIEVDAKNGWTYAGTTIASHNDISVRAGGFVEIFAIPNTSLDTYHLSLAPAELLSIGSDSLPSGAYDITAYSQTNPRTINILGGNGNTIQQVAFDAITTYFASQKPLIWHNNDSLLVSPSEWPLRMIVHQTIAETSVMPPTESVERPRFTVLEKPSSIMDDAILASASGSMLLTPAPAGITPITIGLLEHPYVDTLVRSTLDATFARLRYAELPESCTGKSDPTCDARRYVRDPSILETNDSQSLHAVATDGRRLIGIETLTESGAYAIRTSCQPACNSLCIAGTIANGTCLETAKHGIAAQSAIVAVRGTSGLPSIISNAESRYNTLSTLLFSLRRDGLLHNKKTYVERPNDPRDFSLSLGMFLPSADDNFLVANTTLSMTHIASRAVRSSSAELAIGSAIGHVAAFSALRERASPGFLLRSPEAMRRLQSHLIRRGIMVYPTFDVAGDHLLMLSVQRRLLEGTGRADIVWNNGRLTTQTIPAPGEDGDSLRIRIFGDDSVRTVEQALLLFPGAPANGNVVELLNFGIMQEFITQKMLQLNLQEIMRQQLDTILMLKAEYLLRTSQ